MTDWLWHPLLFLYELLQKLIAFFFSPRAPKAGGELRGPRVAIIGAGLTGVSAAAHCIGHGSEVVLLEAGSRHNLGGIWSRVNPTSSLQIDSIMYRFHPSIEWHKSYPHRGRILEEITRLWHRYKLESRTHFNTRVKSVRCIKAPGSHKPQWLINEDETLGMFDGVIAAIGTCGEPNMIHLPKQEEFRGKIVHSSQLEGVDVRGKKVAIIGGGASAVEVLEYAVDQGAKHADILSRSNKWIIPRNVLVDSFLTMNIMGYETSLSWIPESLLRIFFYRDLQDLAPTDHGFYTSTPMCNDEVLDMIRDGRARWLRGDPESYTAGGINFNHRPEPGVPKGGPGTKMLVRADVIIYATGFHRPDLHFLPDGCFADPHYQPPAWYLQTFPPQQPSICAINSTYINGLGSVGHVHIGMYTRMLLMFLLEPATQPSPRAMRRWIDFTRWLKQRSPVRAFDFFTYSEMMMWFIECVSVWPLRWPWVLFLFFGWGHPASKSTATSTNSGARVKANGS